MAEKLLTWQEKVKQGIPLNELEQVKADAFMTQTRREREAREDQQLAAERQATRTGNASALAEALNADEEPAAEQEEPKQAPKQTKPKNDKE